MRFPIKSKLALGVTFLFIVILTLGILGIFFVNRLSGDTQAILKDNYNSLLYCNNMLKSLDEASNNPQALYDFEDNLSKEENNITEPGESEAVKQLRSFFSLVKSNPNDTTYYDDVRKQIYLVTDLNQEAIQKKNVAAQQTSKSATTWLSIIDALLILFAFTFILNFPGYIANPIKELTEGIREITNKNYDKRVYFSSGDEFGELAGAFNNMAEKLDEYEHSNLSRLMFEKKRIETIIDQMNDAIIGLDANKNILFVNSIAESLIGLNAVDMVGKYAPDVALKNDLLRNLLTKESKSSVVKIVVDGKENFFSKEYKNVMNENEVIGEVIVLKNVTSFKELDVSKTNFIATISHELKTPLSSIKMSTKLLNDARIGMLNKEQNQLIKNINDDADRLLNITGELLDLTQIETGNIQLKKQKIKPGQVIDTAVNATKFQAEQKHVQLKLEEAENLPQLEADPDKTSWVLINLIANAIRFSPEGKEVTIGCHRQDGQLIFSVKDLGAGIDKKFQESIFNRFFQVPEAGEGGSGLGLAICKEFIEAQGGKIWVESEKGKGSTFSFQLSAG